LARKPADQSVHRDDIIAAAADVLRRRGYETTTMSDIAAEVKMTAASLYHHFRNKDSLLLAVLELGLELAISRIEPIACSDAPADDKLRDMIRQHIVGVCNNTAVGAAMVFEIRTLMNAKAPTKNATPEAIASYHEFVDQRAAFFVRRDHFEELFRRVVQSGMEADVFRAVDVPIFVKTLLGANNWVGVWYRPDGRLNGEAIAELIEDYFLISLLKKVLIDHK